MGLEDMVEQMAGSNVPLNSHINTLPINGVFMTCGRDGCEGYNLHKNGTSWCRHLSGEGFKELNARLLSKHTNGSREYVGQRLHSHLCRTEQTSDDLPQRHLRDMCTRLELETREDHTRTKWSSWEDIV